VQEIRPADTHHTLHRRPMVGPTPFHQFACPQCSVRFGSIPTTTRSPDDCLRAAQLSHQVRDGPRLARRAWIPHSSAGVGAARTSRLSVPALGSHPVATARRCVSSPQISTPGPRLAEHTRIWRLICLFVSSSATDKSTRACSVDLHTVGRDFGSLPGFAKWNWAPLRPATRRAGAERDDH
jgi:hypothetical protein